MKNIFTLVLSALIAINLIGQETKKIKKKYENPYYTEEYSVLKSDKSIKHGSFKKLGYKNCLVIVGNYDQGVKEGLWTEYFWRSKIIKNQGYFKGNKKDGEWNFYYNNSGNRVMKAKGNFKGNVRVGVWEFYDFKGNLEQKYDFSTKSLVYFNKPTENPKYNEKTDDGIIKMKLDSPPLFIGGEGEIGQQRMAAKVRYPARAKDSGISGIVVISIFIDDSGKAIDHSVKTSIGGGCDEESLRVSKFLPNNWIPAYKDGKAVTAEYLFPVRFLLR